MIGQHPQMYGFPELHLFSAQTVKEIIETKSKKGKIASPGLLRTLAQEHDGVQSTETILKAINWLMERKDWSTKQLFDYLIDLINPKIGVEKTPNTAKRKKYLERAYNDYQNAYFLHLTRHPVSTRKSMTEFVLKRSGKKKKKNLSSIQKDNNTDGFFLWYNMHRNILNFTNTLPVGQTMRLKGEDLLSYPDLYLPQVAQWLGLSTDSEAIEAMKHPENSPYAYVGPVPCPGGNDPNFMNNPTLRTGIIKEPSLSNFLSQEKWANPQLNYFSSLDQFQNDILSLANLLGYN